MQGDVKPGSQPILMRYMCCQWMSLCRATLESSLRVENLLDVIKNCDDQSTEVLSVHLKFVISTLRHFMEFGLMYQHFPWRFFLLLSGDKALTQSTLLEMKEEWEFVKIIESKENLRKYPYNSVPMIHWFVYREVMTAAEESKWECTPLLMERVQAWFPEPCSTLVADAVFRCQRLGETKQQKNEVSVEQLMATAIKGLNARYKSFNVVNDLDFHGIKPSQFIKKSVFDASRSTATDTGIASFNAIARAPTVSPHHLTRKCLNIFDALKQSRGNWSSFWCAQLVRSGQVLWGIFCLGGLFFFSLWQIFISTSGQ